MPSHRKSAASATSAEIAGISIFATSAMPTDMCCTHITNGIPWARSLKTSQMLNPKPLTKTRTAMTTQTRKVMIALVRSPLHRENKK